MDHKNDNSTLRKYELTYRDGCIYSSAGACAPTKILKNNIYSYKFLFFFFFFFSFLASYSFSFCKICNKFPLFFSFLFWPFTLPPGSLLQVSSSFFFFFFLYSIFFPTKAFTSFILKSQLLPSFYITFILKSQLSFSISISISLRAR